MTNLAVVFLTGLTTGGLSCLAVQGGLLASSVARQVEEDVEQDILAKGRLKSESSDDRGPEYEVALGQLNEQQLSKKAYRKAVYKLKHKYRRKQATIEAIPKTQKHPARPIVLFLISKLIAYTLFGFLLGWAGSFLQLTPFMRSILQIAIGIFMLGTALRMFDIHPIFRYFVIQPPKFITRYIRRFAKNSDSEIATPIFLGALTVLIPCGVTQGMMALAIGTGSPFAGAAILFAFTLGTSPVFFGLAYLATRLGEALHTRFLKVAAIAIFILGLISIEGGLNLMGSPVSFAALKEKLATKTIAENRTSTPSLTNSKVNTPQSPNPDTSTHSNTIALSDRPVHITVEKYGYSPSLVQAKAGVPIKLALATNNTTGCTRAFVIPSLNIQKILPETGTTTVEIPSQKSGTVSFTCSMGMYRGRIEFS